MKINITFNKDGTIKEYCKVPFNEKMPWIEVDDDVIIILNKSYVEHGLVVTPDIQQDKSLEYELETIKAWFTANDWIPNKIVVGEWTVDDERWLTYLSQRTAYRQRQDIIQHQLGLD